MHSAGSIVLTEGIGFILIQLVDLGDTLLKGDACFASLGPEYLVQRVARVLLFSVAIATPNQTFHALLAIGVLLVQLSFGFRLYYTVGWGQRYRRRICR